MKQWERWGEKEKKIENLNGFIFYTYAYIHSMYRSVILFFNFNLIWAVIISTYEVNRFSIFQLEHNLKIYDFFTFFSKNFTKNFLLIDDI